jgi:hypothetical protein
MSVIISHRERKKHKMHHNMHNVTDFLLNPIFIPLPSHSSQHPNSEISKREAPSAPDSLIDQKDQTSSLQEAETPETTSQSTKRKVAEESPVPLPIDNPFFDVPSSREVTDEQLYEEFKAAYIAKGIEKALWRRRRNPNKKKGSTR